MAAQEAKATEKLSDLITKYHKHTGAKQELSRQTWAQLGADLANWEDKAPKPSDLKND